ncbi:hypothetical protein KJ966_12665 [bacterium]|nr:hypothetical protein [bacterium]
MAESISQQVAKFLKKNPNISNADLYAKFPKVRENTLRNYKSKFKGSLSQLKTRKKTTPSKKANDKESTSSLRGKVFEFFKQNPNANNQKLYEEFSDYSKNKLRHYKASFYKSLDSVSEESGKIAKTVTGKLKSRIKSSRDPIAKLEERVNQLERQVKALANSADIAPTSKDAFKATLTDKASGLEKKFRELEENLVNFISEKRKKIKSDMSHLDDIQQMVTEKINSFVYSFREKK